MASGYKQWLVRHTSLGATTATTLQNVKGIRVTRTGKAKTNTAELTLDNYNESYVAGGEVWLKSEDTIAIYAANGDVDITNSAHLIGTYTIIDVAFNSESLMLNVTCIDKTYNMLSRVWAGDKSDTVNNIINNIVQTVSETGSSTADVTTTISSTKSDGSAFSTVQYFTTHKSAYDIIGELSQTEYTGDDRAYIFWFDENNHFYWQYPDQTPETTGFEYGISPVIDMKIKKAESETMSMIIYNAGNDKNDSAVVNFYLDPNAGGSLKNKIKYQPMTDISKRIKRDLEIAGTYSATSNGTFISLLRTAAEARCRSIIQNIGQGLYEAEVKVEGAKYNYGDLYPVSNARQGFPSTNLRINKVQHTFDKKGWITTLTLKEDEAPLEV